MRLIFLPIALFVVLVSFLFVRIHLKTPSTQNSIEQATASEHNGTDDFLEQVKISNGEWVENAGSPIFDNQYVANLPSKLDLQRPSQLASQVLGVAAADGSEKWIEVNLTDQKLYAWEGSRKVMEFPISSGRPGYDTVTGEFRVWRKVDSQTYRGGSRERGDYYYLLNVPFSLFFHQGYAIHGAYWHNDFGIKRRSSGCVNLRPDDAKQVYFWAGPDIPSGTKAVNSTPDNPGVRVVSHY